jgi:hypothetical protein
MLGRDIGAISLGYIPSAVATPEVRKGFSTADKKRSSGRLRSEVLPKIRTVTGAIM